MINSPETLPLALRILTREPRQPECPILHSQVRVLQKQLLRRRRSSELQDLGEFLGATNDTPQDLGHDSLIYHLAPLNPVRLEEGVESLAQDLLRVRGVQNGEGADGAHDIQGQRREIRRHVLEHWDVELLGPVQPLLIDPDVFVWR